MMFLSKRVRQNMQEKCSCSKEPIGTIPIVRVIDKIDEKYVEKLLHDCFKEDFYALSVVSPIGQEARRV